MDIVVCSPNNFRINGRLKTGFRLEDYILHWLQYTHDQLKQVIYGARGRLTTTLRGVPFDTDPRQVAS